MLRSRTYIRGTLAQATRMGNRSVARAISAEAASLACQIQSSTALSVPFLFKSAQFSTKRHTVNCAGCGVELQTRSKDGAGFVPRADLVQALQAKAAIGQMAAQASSGLICQRCYRSKHYGSLAPVGIPAAEFDAYLRAIRDVDCLVIKVLDAFDFEGSMLPHAGAMIGDKPMLLVLNKCDLLPRGTQLPSVLRWARRRAKAAGLRGVLDLVPVSSLHGQGFRALCDAIKTHRKGRDVYVIGGANVGKSSLVNRLLAEVWLGEVPLVDPAQARRDARRNKAVHLQAPPPGMAPGDVFVGNWADLDAQARLEVARSHAEADTGAPAPRWAVADAGWRGGGGSATAAGDSAYSGGRHVEGGIDQDMGLAGALRFHSEGESIGAGTTRTSAQGQTRGGGASLLGGGTGDGAMSGRTASVGAALPAALLPRRLQEAASRVGGDASQGGESIEGALQGVQGGLRSTYAAPVMSPEALAASLQHALSIPLTTSPLPGTTLGVVAAPLTQHSRVYDTPGVITDPARHALLEAVAAKGGAGALKTLVCPTKPLRAQHFRLSPGRSLFLGGLFRLDYNSEFDGVNVIATVFSQLPVHVTSTERADKVFQAGAGSRLVPSTGEMALSLEAGFMDFVPRVAEHVAQHGHARMSGNDGRTRRRRQERTRRAVLDVCLGGMGWVSFTPIEIEGMWGWGKSVQGGHVRALGAPGVVISAREPLLPHAASGTSPRQWRTESDGSAAVARSPLDKLRGGAVLVPPPAASLNPPFQPQGGASAAGDREQGHSSRLGDHL